MTPKPALPIDATALATLHCSAGAKPLTPAEVADHLQALPGWSSRNGAIEKLYTFADFHETIGFVNALAFIANGEDHHPDLRVSYDRCLVIWSTHDAGGITQNDVICAARTDRLFA
jgi:4a-hydroxytetrahydrobiopterin dehydratase